MAEGVGPVFRLFAHVQQTGEGLVSRGSEMFLEVEQAGCGDGLREGPMS